MLQLRLNSCTWCLGQQSHCGSLRSVDMYSLRCVSVHSPVAVLLLVLLLACRAPHCCSPASAGAPGAGRGPGRTERCAARGAACQPEVGCWLKKAPFLLRVCMCTRFNVRVRLIVGGRCGRIMSPVRGAFCRRLPSQACQCNQASICKASLLGAQLILVRVCHACCMWLLLNSAPVCEPPISSGLEDILLAPCHQPMWLLILAVMPCRL